MVLQTIRFILAIIYGVFASITGLLICIIRPFHPTNTYYMGRLFGIPMLKIFGIKIVVEDREQFKKIPESAVIISNHQNNYDIFVIGQITPKRTVSLGKKSIRLLPLFGQMYWLAGNILINRTNKRSAMKTMSQAGQKMISRHLKVWIMPEGTRSRGRGLLPFKKGAFHIASQSNLSIFPVALSSYELHLNTKKWHAGTVKIKVLPPVDVVALKAAYEGDDFVNFLKSHCEEIIKNAVAALDQEVYGKVI